MSLPLRVENATGPVPEIVLSRPDKHNAMNPEMGALLAQAVDRLNAQAGARVVLVRGEGRAFCAGGDFDLIAANAERSPEGNRIGMLEFYRSFLSVLRLRVPTIAVLHGATVGAGLCLALACDLRFAASEAKLGANFVRIGLHPGMGASVLLPRLVGPALASELLLTGRLIDGAEAARIGLVNAAVPRAELEARVAAVVSELLAAAPLALAQTKASLLTPLFAELDAALAREANAQAIDFTTSDLREAVAAFRAGRAPTFTGA